MRWGESMSAGTGWTSSGADTTGGFSVRVVFDAPPPKLVRHVVEGQVVVQHYGECGPRNCPLFARPAEPRVEDVLRACQVLGLDPRTTAPAEARKRYRQLARTHHPDVGGDPERMKEINAAWDLLRRASGGALG